MPIDDDDVQILGETKGEKPKRRSRRITGEVLKQREKRKREEPKKKGEEPVKFEHKEPRTKKMHDVNVAEDSDVPISEWVVKVVDDDSVQKKKREEKKGATRSRGVDPSAEK
ncbi:hypothetical protein Dimus_027106 [Dionaea muscipula]